MKVQQKTRILVFRLTLWLAGCLCLPLVSAGELNGTDWKITSGDTLYAIGRSVYPGDAARQAKLRQDIMILNPAVFAGDQINMQIGAVLKLPQYVVDSQASGPEVESIKPAPVISTVPVVEPIKPAPAPVVSTAPVQTRETWIVESGDTLYSIGRSLFPEDLQKQAVLRRDIVKLNRPAFANGAENLEIGTALALPKYVDDSALADAAKAPLATVPAATVAAAKPETARPAASEPVSKPETARPAASEPVSKPEPPAAEPETTAVNEPVSKPRTQSGPEAGANNFLVSLGLAYGGDELVGLDSGFDITGGSGINLRLGYQKLPEQGSGYRTALGLQYHQASGASLQDTYFQLAYHYRVTDLLYGVGLVAHSGADVDDGEIDIEFDSSVGLFVYLENVGSGGLGGWGLSLASLEIESDDVDGDVDASSAEIYYSWNF